MLQVLAAWDGRSVADVVKDERFQAGHTIFLDWLPRAVKATFEDELAGIEDFKVVRSGLFNFFLRCIDGPASTLPVSRPHCESRSSCARRCCWTVHRDPHPRPARASWTMASCACPGPAARPRHERSRQSAAPAACRPRRPCGGSARRLRPARDAARRSRRSRTPYCAET